MPFKGLLAQMTAVSNPVKAQKMSAYMRGMFPFLGVQTPLRREISRPFFKILGSTADFNFIDLCWKSPFRELQYIGVDHLIYSEASLNRGHLEKIALYITEKSWWDTVDHLDNPVGLIFLRDKSARAELITWAQSPNLWLRRAAIDCQLQFKEKTDTDLLEEVIGFNLGSKEFFINKAIGWILRDYSKTNPQWVRSFVVRHSGQLSPLSRKEASKFL